MTEEDREMVGLGVNPAREPILYADPRFPGDQSLPVTVHPDVILAEDPDLWEPVSQFRYGVRRKLSRADWETRSAHFCDCIMLLANAHHRKRERDLKLGSWKAKD